MKSEYDYIVVGSGSAGAVIAARLTEDPSLSVLLLEAGPRDSHPLQVMPLAFLKLAHGNVGTFQYKTEPEPGLYGRQLEVPRGRTLGGTSSINAMIAIRGHRRDYDRWHELGLEGWSYPELLPYFKRLETHWRGAGPYHGGSGPIHITRMQSPHLLWEPLLASALAEGIAVCEDPNGAEQDGISRLEATIGEGRRSSAARAYLHPAMRRVNLRIETDALTHRVLVAHARATGVEYRQRGQLRTVHAAREVIICGGAYNSPQLLMLSGIGPADELRAAGVTPIHDLPGVGRNLSEHPNIMNEVLLHGEVGLTRFLRVDRAVLSAARWFVDHQGPFAYNGATANVFSRSREGLGQPDVQLTFLPICNGATLWTPGIDRKPPSRMSVRIGNIKPQSRGWVKLRSTDPADAPRIQMNLFDVAEDLDPMVWAIRQSRRIFAQSPLRGMIRGETLPGPEILSDADLKEHIRRNAGHRSHPVGTCRMGVDADAVVDAQLRVRGIEGLRVADASVMPEVPGGNTNLPSMMVGERAADHILGRRLPPEP